MNSGCLGLDQLVQELERRKKNSRDVVVDSEKIWASADVAGIQLGMWDNGSREYFQLNDWAHRQLAEKTGIPFKYYQRIQNAGNWQLLADNVNAWLQEKERRLIRIQDGKVRAILSDRYRPLDDFDFLCCALEEFKEYGKDVNIVRCDLTEQHLYLKAVLPYSEQKIREDDGVVPGVILSNSEVGAGSFKIEPFAVRLICKNGLIGETIVRQVHIGERRATGNFWSDATLQKKDEVFWSEIKDVIRATLRLESFTKWFASFRQATFEKIESPATALESVGVKLKMSAKRRASLVDYFITQGEATQWGLGNAISRLGQDENEVEDQIDFERIAGQISALPGLEFQRFILPARGVSQLPIVL